MWQKIYGYNKLSLSIGGILRENVCQMSVKYLQILINQSKKLFLQKETYEIFKTNWGVLIYSKA